MKLGRANGGYGDLLRIDALTAARAMIEEEATIAAPMTKLARSVR
jgi:hypothetical protein